VRKIEDIEKIKASIESGRTVIIGGGLLGLELAGAIANTGKEVTVIEIFERLLPKQLDNQGAALLKKALEKKGIRFLIGREILEIVGDESLKKIVLKDGKEIECKTAIFSAGAKPEIEIALFAGINVNRGIIVNDKMESSKNGVYAAGDVAEHGNICYGLWLPAKEQGEYAGKNMAGNKEEYRGTPLEARMRVCGISLFSAGEFLSVGEVLSYEDENSYIKAVINGDKLQGAISVGNQKAASLFSNVLHGKEDIKSMYRLFMEVKK